ncbi:MAG: hypothetical protein ACT4O3_10440 [Elusimicrobiota bacterium]
MNEGRRSLSVLGNSSGTAALVIILFIALLIAMPAGFQMISSIRQQTRQSLRMDVQAGDAASGGIVDALSWFRRQPVQPVAQMNDVAYLWPDAAFHPRQADGSTIDESIGIVKEYPVSDSTNLWARYEVRRQSANPAVAPLVERVHDITNTRYPDFSNGDGLAWILHSRGYIFRRKDAALPYNQAPNTVLATAEKSTEIRRLALTLPFPAAAIVSNRNGVSVGAFARIAGGPAAGLGYYEGLTWTGSGTVTGNPDQMICYSTNTPVIPGMPAAYPAETTKAVFGATQQELRLMADVNANGVGDLPAAYPSMALVYINGNAAFGASRKLQGGGILYVNGNLDAPAAAQMRFYGLIFCTGNVAIEPPGSLEGTLFALGSVNLNAPGPLEAEVLYSPSALETVTYTIGAYRELRSPQKKFLGVK